MTILGIDEVGRGALAGPVVLGGVRITEKFPLLCHHIQPGPWFEQNQNFKIVRDSKKISETKRNNIVTAMNTMLFDRSILFCSNTLIDTFGIGTCLSHMVYILVNQLPASETIIDGKIKILNSYNTQLLESLLRENSIQNKLIHHPTLTQRNSSHYIFVQRETKADDKYFSIALASIISKVERDKYMVEISRRYPEYEWQQNKGYGTQKHRKAIKNNSDNQYLRKTFLKKIIP